MIVWQRCFTIGDPAAMHEASGGFGLGSLTNMNYLRSARAIQAAIACLCGFRAATPGRSPTGRTMIQTGYDARGQIGFAFWCSGRREASRSTGGRYFARDAARRPLHAKRHAPAPATCHFAPSSCFSSCPSALSIMKSVNGCDSNQWRFMSWPPPLMTSTRIDPPRAL